ncbi:helix-turn-helix transcriptional regulator [Paenibacillus hemerocallicola]|uniref:Helix-turn-helix transcriptional regulator n=1 Tax=Paenibacillus hemerocallicola TaxID=1172614 RepID=A0A5C4T5L1_9BACL|nr:AraC family transcriptional regulator [Paenibacillus hemerocallicola]TNJ64361.1 helix-turn-helix transcriptional regulator [Paenibacillus hemerocallicola]
MFVKICSIHTNEIITSGSSTHWNVQAEYYAYIEIFGSLHLQGHKTGQRLQHGDVLIGRKFRLVNTTAHPVTVRGIIFQWGAASEEWERSLIVHSQNSFAIQATSIVAPLFAENRISTEVLPETERQLYSLLQSLHVEKENVLTPAKRPIGKIDSRLITVNRYIRNNYMRPLTLQYLADLVRSNPVYLCNSYSKVFRVSPIKYLQNLKMAKAQEWLVSTDFTIGVIAEQLGYISQSQFGDLFKRYFGITPTQYRRNKGINGYGNSIGEFGEVNCEFKH